MKANKANPKKIDDAVLALLHLTSFRENKESLFRAWKGHDWETMERLPKKRFISDPECKAKSVVMTEEGTRRAEELFLRLVCE